MTIIPPSPLEFEEINGHIELADNITFFLDGADVDYSSVDSVTANYVIGPSFEMTMKLGPPVGPNATNTHTYFYIWKPGADVDWEYVEWQILSDEAGGLDLMCDWQPRPGLWTEVARAPYDPVAHQWLRFTVVSGTLFWKTSPNGLTWSVFASIPFPASWTPGGPIGIELDFSVYDNAQPYSGLTFAWDYFAVNDTGTERLIFGELPAVDVPDPRDPTKFKSATACVEVTGEGHVLDIAAGVWIIHPKLENLEIWLRGPSPYNKRALLVDHNGSGSNLGEGYEDHQIVIFEDDGADGAVADWGQEYGRVGNYVPITSLLDTYAGTDIDDYANGLWCIDVVDTSGETTPEIWEYCLYIVSDRIPLSPLGQLWPRGGGDRMIDALNTKFHDRQLLVGSGRPFPDIGEAGDCYLDVETTILYGPKGNSGWNLSNFSVLGRLANTIVVYEQPNRPHDAPLGAIWLDTDG